MRKEIFAEGEHYHIYNRGVEKRDIFASTDDYWRFITLMLVFQGDVVIPQISRIVKDVKKLDFSSVIFEKIIKNPIVGLEGFCLMPNHFHLVLKEIKEGGISRFMLRLGDAYTKYFNIKYSRTGHLFGGTFQSVHIDINKYLLYLSAYIHLNPSKIIMWEGEEYKYPWSSFQDFTKENRWGELLNASLILEQFNSGKDYLKFVKEADFSKELDPSYIIEC